ncbi:MAG: hypothetical protein IKP82_06385 [Oscillospiraceae bacterium]|nr:hypothetical protein [Oscillospiraceae bacterium]
MNTYREFALAVRNGESGTVMDYVTERIDALWKAKLETAPSDFEQALHLEFQQSERIKDGNPTLLFSTAYHVGRRDGFLDAMEKLYYREESLRIAQETVAQLEDGASQTQAAQEPTPRPSERVIQILECLNRHGEMRHGDLAEAVDSSPSALSNLMKKILQTGLARSRRTGRNTCYEVTDLGRHFCRQEAQREAQRAEFDAAEKRAQELAEQVRQQEAQLEELRAEFDAAVEKRAQELAKQMQPSRTDRSSQVFGKKPGLSQKGIQNDLLGDLLRGKQYVRQKYSGFSNLLSSHVA